jgi:hypothetical protein
LPYGSTDAQRQVQQQRLTNPSMSASIVQVILKPLYFLHISVGARTADKLNNVLLADWVSRLTLGQLAAVLGGIGIFVVTAAVGPTIIKRPAVV